jgi:hypothetical protein
MGGGGGSGGATSAHTTTAKSEGSESSLAKQGRSEGEISGTKSAKTSTVEAKPFTRTPDSELSGRQATLSVSGDTFPVRDLIKAEGYRWDPHLREWTKKVPEEHVLDIRRQGGLEVPKEHRAAVIGQVRFPGVKVTAYHGKFETTVLHHGSRAPSNLLSVKEIEAAAGEGTASR